MSPGSFTTDATEIFQEGLQIPTVKLIAAGREQEAVFEILRSNIRLPQDSMGDLHAATAACSVGEARLGGLFEPLRAGRRACGDGRAA